MSRSIICFLYKPEDLCLDPQDPCKKPYIMMHVCHADVHRGEGVWGEVTASLVVLASSRFSDRLAQKWRWRRTEEDNFDLWSWVCGQYTIIARAHTHAHAHVQMKNSCRGVDADLSEGSRWTVAMVTWRNVWAHSLDLTFRTALSPPPSRPTAQEICKHSMFVQFCKMQRQRRNISASNGSEESMLTWLSFLRRHCPACESNVFHLIERENKFIEATETKNN